MADEASIGENYKVAPTICWLLSFVCIVYSFPVGDVDTPELAGAESFELEAHSNLDRFFSRIYK